MENKITTFIFDCFGVISDPVLNGWYRDNRLKHGLIDPNLRDTFSQFDLGKLSEDDILDYFLSYDGVNKTKDELRVEIDNYLRLDNKLVDFIKKLRSNGFKVLLLSDCNASFFRRKVFPTYPEFKDLFDEIILSSDVGMTKAEHKMFLMALDKVNSKPEECLFIDDNKPNVDRAVSLGINGFVYTKVEPFLEYVKSLGINVE